MGSGASMYKTPEEALAAGVSQADIDKFLKENPNALKPPENAVQPVGPSTLSDDLTGKRHPTALQIPISCFWRLLYSLQHKPPIAAAATVSARDVQGIGYTNTPCIHIRNTEKYEQPLHTSTSTL